MPTNLRPESLELEKKFREAQSLPEKIRALEAYIGSIPEHKGTMRLRSHLKKKLVKLREEQRVSRRKRAGVGPRTPYDIKKEGAAQVVLLGPTQSGKSFFLKVLTGAEVEVSPRLYTSTKPTVGMMPYEDIQIQIIDTPALLEGAARGKGWGPQVLGLVRNSDAVAVVLSLEGSVEDQFNFVMKELAAAEITPLHGLGDAGGRLGDGELGGKVSKPFLFVLNKADINAEHGKGAISTLKTPDGGLPVMVSGLRGVGLEGFKETLFTILGIMRVYTRRPGSKEVEKPIILRRSARIIDLARGIHTDLLRRFRFAKIWGPSAKYPGERVGLETELRDKDIVEIYAR